MNGEAGKLAFVDTNVLVYAYDRQSGEKHEIAKRSNTIGDSVRSGS